MGKSSKKSATKVDAAPAIAAPPSKPLKKGKREAENAIDKQVALKKQKKDETALKQAIVKQKTETKTKKKSKKVESSSSEDDSSSESEEETKVKPAAKLPLKKATESSSDDDSSSSDEDVTVKSAVPSKNGTVGIPAAKGKVSSSSSDDSESDSEDEDPKKKVPAVAVAKNVPVATKKKDESSDDSDDSSSSDDDTHSKKLPASCAKNGSVAVTKKKEESSDDSDSEEDSDEDETPAKLASKAAPANESAVASKKGTDDSLDSESDDSEDDEAPAPKAALSKKSSSATVTKQESSSEEDSSEEESSDGDTSEEDKQASKTPKKRDTDVEMVDAESTKTDAKKAPQTPRTPQVQATGSKTLFVGNLSFSVEQADVENFFKEAGEVADVRFATDRDGTFKGFGHVEFTSVEGAQKALELNGQELLGRAVRLDLARERGEYTPSSGKENSYQSGGKPQGQTIFVRGFDTSDGEEKIRSGLEEHFGTCGDISRVSIPKDYEGGVKGIAYMDFTDGDGFNKALELNGSEFGGSYLTVEEAKPRSDSRDSFGSGRGRGRDSFGSGRGRGRDSFGRGRGRDGGGRFGRGDGGRSGGRRGRGGSNRPSMAAAGTGKKTTFDD